MALSERGNIITQLREELDDKVEEIEGKTLEYNTLFEAYNQYMVAYDKLNNDFANLKSQSYTVIPQGLLLEEIWEMVEVENTPPDESKEEHEEEMGEMVEVENTPPKKSRKIKNKLLT